MADDPDLVERIRTCLAPLGATEKKMFGGTCFLVRGNMVVGTFKGELLVRVGKDGHDAALADRHAHAMKMGDRTMRGFIAVSSRGTATAAQLRSWINRGVAVARALPPKPAARPSKSKRRSTSR